MVHFSFNPYHIFSTTYVIDTLYLRGNDVIHNLLDNYEPHLKKYKEKINRGLIYIELVSEFVGFTLHYVI